MDNGPVIVTNEHVTAAKRSAVALGYWKDDYLPEFIGPVHDKSPLGHRRFYIKTKCVDLFVKKFLDSVDKTSAQIVNLGAGFETLFWRLKEQNVEVSKFVEVDFPPVTSKKCYKIEKSELLLDKLRDKAEKVIIGATDLHSGGYHLVAADLSNVSELENKLIQSGINWSAPTLFIIECVLIYIEKEYVDRLLSWIAAKFQSTVCINYEFCNLESKAGAVMMSGFNAKGCNLAGAVYCKNTETHVSKFLNNNWNMCKSWDIFKLYESVPESEKERLNKIEVIEQKYLDLMSGLFCISMSWIGKAYEDLSSYEPSFE